MVVLQMRGPGLGVVGRVTGDEVVMFIDEVATGEVVIDEVDIFGDVVDEVDAPRDEIAMIQNTKKIQRSRQSKKNTKRMAGIAMNGLVFSSTFQ